MTTTATRKTKPAQTATAKSILASRLEEKNTMLIAAYETLTAIELRTDPLEVANIDVTAGEMMLLKEAGFESRSPLTSNHDLLRLLRRQRATRENIESLANSSLVRAAKAIEAAEEALLTTKAQIEDLDFDDPNFTGITLQRQIAKLNARLVELKKNRDYATQSHGKLKAKRAWLITHAPQPVKDRVAVRLAKAKNTEAARRRRRLRPEIDGLAKSFVNGDLRDILGNVNNGALVPYFEINNPEVLSKNRYGTTVVDREKLDEHVKKIRNEVLPELREEYKQAEATLQAAEEEARKPFDEWIEEGKLTLSMLQ